MEITQSAGENIIVPQVSGENLEVSVRPGESFTAKFELYTLAPESRAYLDGVVKRVEDAENLAENVELLHGEVVQSHGEVQETAKNLLEKQEEINTAIEDVNEKQEAITEAAADVAQGLVTFGQMKTDMESISVTVAENSSAAKVSETNAANSATEAGESAAAAASSATEAGKSSTASASSAEASSNSEKKSKQHADASGQSAADSASSSSSASGHKTAAANSAAAALDSQNKSKTSETNSKSSETNSKASETAALEHKNTVAELKTGVEATAETISSQADQVASNAVGAALSETLARRWASETEGVEVEPGKYSAEHWARIAERFGGAAVNSLTFRGAWDATKGAPPEPVPETPDFYKITVPGTIAGVEYDEGDNIVWDTEADLWFRIDNSDRPISDSLTSTSSVTSASSKAVNLLDSKKFDKSGGEITAPAAIVSLISEDDTQASTLNLHGVGVKPGAGKLFVGKNTSRGGGIAYFGSQSPDTLGVGSEQIAIYRRYGANEYWTAKNSYSSNTWYFRGQLYADQNQRVFADNYHPNADKLTTARSISVTLSGGVSGTVSQTFDGSEDIAFTVPVELGSHTHAISEIVELQTALDGKYSPNNKPSKSDVGLGSVPNYSASSSVTSDSASTFATSRAAKLAHDKGVEALGVANAALPKSGGTLTGSLVVHKTNPTINMQSTGSGASLSAWISYRDSGNTERGYVGYGSSGNTHLHLHNSIGSVFLSSSGGNSTRISNDNGYLDLGAQNTSHCHYITDRPNHWFNKEVRVNGEIYCGSSYDKRVYHTGYKPSKSDVGLGNVPNYTITSSVSDSSNSKFATAGAVRSAYNLAAGKLARVESSGHLVVPESKWFRAATTGVGFLPNTSGTSGTSYLGTSGWYFKEAWVRNYRGYHMNISSSVVCSDLGITSDYRLKSEIKPLENALDTVCSWNAYSYTKDGSVETGFLAQEIEKTQPHLVSTRESDHFDDERVLHYTQTIAYLAAAVKELRSELAEVKRGLTK
ncbi:tail fiber domain-containing protein [Parendozoicomonas haliclonae]|uniref:Peptidase S74 domain-containing protein n=1 Tax=Parendozoicomonas haliclonae TaxID=1960125 RepID=A0A1X7AEM0_9GAMM|nr:hypothetical protein EHSB41UT_00254 [Parendozoicomonas haliclonae]